MKKFKSFMASVLTYLMLLSLIPSSFVEIVVKAAENEVVDYVKNDYYLNNIFQYQDKIVTVMGAEEGCEIVLFKSGEEIVLKSLKDTSQYDIRKYIISDSKIQFVETEYNNETELYDIKNIYEYDGVANELRDVPKEDYTSESSLYLGEYRSIYQGKKSEYRFLFQEILDKINKKYNTEYTLSMFNCDDEESDNYIYFEIKDKYERRSLYAGSKLISLEDSLIDFSVYVRNDDEEIRYSGIYNSNFEFVSNEDNGYYSKYTLKRFDSHYDDVYILEKVSEKEILVHKIKDNKIESTKKINFNNESNYIIDIRDDKVFISEGYGSCEVVMLNLDGDSYINKGNSIKFSSDEIYSIDKSGNLWITSFLEKEIKISKYENNELTLKYVLKNLEDSHYAAPLVYDENNIFMTSIVSGSLFINIPQKSSDDEEVTPPTEDNNENQEDVNNPSENAVLDIAVEKLNPNEVNEVSEVAEDTTNFNIIVKDIEALKNGQGSLKAMLNNVTLNLPFSVLDKTLLDENDTVSVRLDVLSDSEITKDLKAVNKVFDFNLVVNKENEGVRIHNFKEGVAEITITLSDAEFEELNKDKLKVYYYNEETKNFEAMETKVDGNNITFTTSHFSKYVIAEEIVDNTIDKPETDKDESIVIPDKEENDDVVIPDNDEVIIKPDTDINSNTDVKPNNNSNNETNKEENKTESGKGELPITGSVVSNNTILVLALGVVLIGGAMFFKKKKVA